MKSRVDKVLGQTGIRLSFFGHLDALVLRRHSSQLFAVKFQLVQVSHRCERKRERKKKSYSMSRDIRDYNFKITKLGLMRFGHLNKGRILFVEQDLHPVDITVNTCR
jgi:hypothetical protein